MAHSLAQYSLSGVGLFPLPNVVLLPHQLLALHVFEPRYRALVADALDLRKPIAVPLLMHGFEPDYYGSPAIHRVFGVGRILNHERLPDGRYHVLLRGVGRARLLSEDTSGAFRRAELDEVLDLPAQTNLAPLHAEVQALGQRALAHADPNTRTRIERAQHDAADLGLQEYVLADLIDAPQTRQQLLECRDPTERLTRLMACLAELAEVSDPASSSRWN